MRLSVDASIARARSRADSVSRALADASRSAD
jgi:hypothetical protein